MAASCALMARPALAAGVALAMMETLADFGAVAVFNYDTFTTAIYRTWYGMGNREGAAQLSMVLILIAIALVAVEFRSRGRARFTIASNLRYVAEPVQLPLIAGLAALAACAKKEEVVYTDPPAVTTEPTYTGKL